MSLRPSILDAHDAYIWPLTSNGSYSAKSGYNALITTKPHARPLHRPDNWNWKKNLWNPPLQRRMLALWCYGDTRTLVLSMQFCKTSMGFNPLVSLHHLLLRCYLCRSPPSLSNPEKYTTAWRCWQHFSLGLLVSMDHTKQAHLRIESLFSTGIHC